MHAVDTAQSQLFKSMLWDREELRTNQQKSIER